MNDAATRTNKSSMRYFVSEHKSNQKKSIITFLFIDFLTFTLDLHTNNCKKKFNEITKNHKQKHAIKQIYANSALQQQQQTTIYLLNNYSSSITKHRTSKNNQVNVYENKCNGARQKKS